MGIWPPAGVEGAALVEEEDEAELEADDAAACGGEEKVGSERTSFL